MISCNRPGTICDAVIFDSFWSHCDSNVTPIFSVIPIDSCPLNKNEYFLTCLKFNWRSSEKNTSHDKIRADATGQTSTLILQII